MTNVCVSFLCFVVWCGVAINRVGSTVTVTAEADNSQVIEESDETSKGSAVNEWDLPVFHRSKDRSIPKPAVGTIAAAYRRSFKLKRFKDYLYPCVRDRLQRVLVFGGYPDPSTDVRGSWVYTPPVNSWYRLPLLYQPSDRTGHVMATMCETTVVLFGGLQDRKRYAFNDTWLFDGIREEWERLEVKVLEGEVKPRAFHTGVVLKQSESRCQCKDALFVFGGMAGYGNTSNLAETSDLLELRCDEEDEGRRTYMWYHHQRYNESSEWPERRYLHHAVAINSSTMIAYGGQQGDPTTIFNAVNVKDAWLFDIKRYQWQRFSTSGSSVPYDSGQFRSCSVLDKKHNKVLHILGNAVFSLDVKVKKWTQTRTVKDKSPSLVSPETMMIGLTAVSADLEAVSADSSIIVFSGIEQNQDLLETKVWYLTFICNVSVWLLTPLPKENPPPDRRFTYLFSSQVGQSLFIPVVQEPTGSSEHFLANDFVRYAGEQASRFHRKILSPLHRNHPSNETLNLYNARITLSMVLSELAKYAVVAGSVWINELRALTVWQLDFLTNTWWQYSNSGPYSCFPYTASTSWKDTDLLTYGGLRSLDFADIPVLTSDVCIYDVKQRRWLESESVNSPPYRAFPSIVDTGNGSVVLFGGYRCPWTAFVKFAFGDVIKKIGKLVNLPKDIFDKYSSNCSMQNDMWILKLSKGDSSVTAQWTQILPNSSSLPSGRIFHTLLAVNSKLFVAGGISDELRRGFGIRLLSLCSVELSYFDLTSRRWYNVKPHGDDGILSLTHPLHMCKVKAISYGRKILAVRSSVNMTQLPYDSRTDSVLSLFLDSNEEAWIQQTGELPFRVENLYAWKERVFATGSMRTFNEEYSYIILPIETQGKRTLTAMRPGCHAGWYSSNWSVEACSQCQMGTYSLAGSTTCDGCPDGLTTSGAGAPNRSSCICQSDHCGKYGVCFVSSSNGQLTAECQCDFGYTGGQCQYPTYYIITGVSLAVLVILLCLFVFLQKMIKYRRMKRAREMELEEMGRVWTIESSELRLIERIDRETPGSYGNIYRARYRDMTVAVKKLKMIMREGRVEREFEREILLMRSIRHPNIVLFVGAGRFPNDGCPFLVLEFMQRGALSGILHDLSVQFNSTQQTTFCLDAAKGMEFLHSLQPPRIHRDMKSSNLLVSEGWVVKVADFGSARLVKSQGTRQAVARRRDGPFQEEDATTPLLQAHSDLSRNAGAVLWRAPEIFLGEAYGTSADVYSFGIVMWEIVVRQIPYEDRGYEWIQEVKDAVLSGIRPTLRQGCAGEAYISLMQQCWASEPEQRPPFDEIVNRLQGMLPEGMRGNRSTDAVEMEAESDV